MSKNEVKNFLVYSLPDEEAGVDVIVKDENIWISQKGMAELFGIDRTGIGKHLKNIFSEGELDEEVVCANFAHTTFSSSSPSEKIFFKCFPIPVLSIPKSSDKPF